MIEQYSLFDSEMVLQGKRKNYCQISRENVAYYSAQTIDLPSLLAIIIGSKATPEICGMLASLGMKKLASMSVSEFQEFDGIGEVAATNLVASFEIARKMVQSMNSPEEEKVTIRSPEDVSRLLMPKLRDLTQEHFVCLFLDTKNQVIGEETIFIGSLNASIVHPREVYKEAIKRSCASIIVSHNHPSGSVDPSKEDIEVTKRLKQVGEMVGIDLLDHVIIGYNRYFSLKEKGLI